MRKIIAALNMTLDGICDHTAGIPDEEIHQHYTELLRQGDTILYGRTTYQLMEFWRTILENPSEEKSMNDFALAIDNIPKIVFSHTLKNIEWESAQLATKEIEKEVLELIVQEYTSKEIAEKLFISKQTVDTHRINIMQKTDCKTLVGLIKYAIQSGYIK